ncbi:MAG: leucyl/phenylalanyl-tRNA--protein transferase [Pirellulales bacterium]|nr:leucyl/phenylalanyl-tRNA--protein transferase [Pirellulales bacterium]
MATTAPSRFFPPADWADPQGLVFIGGKLTPTWLLDAYRHGIFPWPLLPDHAEMLWWSPDPRAIFEFDSFYVSRRLARTVRSGKFTVTSDQAFAQVLHGCATAQDRTGETWLTAELQAAYGELHQLGHAHSVEVWHAGELAGGTYGVSVGGLFAAESMFHYMTDASKVALAVLLPHLRRQGYQLVDIQQLTNHTASLGAIEIPRREYLRRLNQALRVPARFGSLG